MAPIVRSDSSNSQWPSTVTRENEVGVDLVLIQPYLLYYVNHVVFLYANFFLKHNFLNKRKDVCIKIRSTQPHVQSKARILSPQRA